MAAGKGIRKNAPASAREEGAPVPPSTRTPADAVPVPGRAALDPAPTSPSRSPSALGNLAPEGRERAGQTGGPARTRSKSPPSPDQPPDLGAGTATSTSRGTQGGVLDPTGRTTQADDLEKPVCCPLLSTLRGPVPGTPTVRLSLAVPDVLSSLPAVVQAPDSVCCFVRPRHSLQRRLCGKNTLPATGLDKERSCPQPQSSFGLEIFGLASCSLLAFNHHS